MAQQIKIKKDAAYIEAVEELAEKQRAHEAELLAKHRTLFGAWRAESGLSVDAVADEAAVSPNAICSLELRDRDFWPVSDELQLSIEGIFLGRVGFGELFCETWDPARIAVLSRAHYIATNGH
jgi:hypothetical protein